MSPWQVLMLVCMLGSATANAQADSCSFQLTGTVLDNHDGQQLDFATVLILETGDGTVSDSAGTFVFNALCEGTYTLRFSHIGCETKERTVNVKGNESITLRLEHHAEILETVTLTARKLNQAGSVSRDEISQQELIRVQGQALGECMKALPGVNAIQTGPAIFKPVIHGLHSNRVLIVNDGIRQESQQWGLDHAPEIDPFLANTITVVKGAAAVQYGADAVAGVILVESDTLPHESAFGGKVAAHGMSNGWQGGVSAMIEKGFASGLGFRWHGTVKRSGDKNAPKYNLTNTGMWETNTSIAAGFARGLNSAEVSYSLFRTEIGILRSAHIGNLTDLEEALERGEPYVIEDFSYAINNPRQAVTHHIAKLKGQFWFENVGVLSGHYAVQFNNRSEFDVRRGGRDEIPALDLQLNSQSGLLQLAHEEIIGLRGKVALHWHYQQNTNVPGTGVRPLIPNYTSASPGISIVEKWIGEKIEVEAGLRYEFEYLLVKRFDANNNLLKPEFNFNNFSTSAGMRWGFNDDFSLTANLGTTNRAPNVNELFSEGLHHGAAAIEEGDSSLTPEKAIKLVLGLEYTTQRIQAKLTTYSQVIRDFIYLRPEGEPRLTVRGAFPVFQYVQDNARMWGLDGAIAASIVSGLRAEVKYSMVRATNTDEDEPLIFMPSDRMQAGLNWTSSSSRWEAGFSVSHVWEQTRAPEDLDYAPPPPAYTLVGLTAGTHFSIGSDQLDVYLTVSNLFNTSYREYLNRLRYFADDVGRNIELRLNYQF